MFEGNRAPCDIQVDTTRSEIIGRARNVAFRDAPFLRVDRVTVRIAAKKPSPLYEYSRWRKN
jgi:hypothetical protein